MNKFKSQFVQFLAQLLIRVIQAFDHGLLLQDFCAISLDLFRLVFRYSTICSARPMRFCWRPSRFFSGHAERFGLGATRERLRGCCCPAPWWPALASASPTSALPETLPADLGLRRPRPSRKTWCGNGDTGLPGNGVPGERVGEIDPLSLLPLMLSSDSDESSRVLGTTGAAARLRRTFGSGASFAKANSRSSSLRLAGFAISLSRVRFESVVALGRVGAAAGLRRIGCGATISCGGNWPRTISTRCWFRAKR